MLRPAIVKAWLGGSGIVCGLLGVALEWRWLVGTALGMLVAAFLLRFAQRRAREL